MPQLFPPEIIKSSCENYFAENSTTSRIIYLSVIVFSMATISLLPFINVQVTTQSEGVVRSGYEDNPVVPVVTGEVLSCRICENQAVSENDTILVIASHQINEDLVWMNYRLKDEELLLSDLKKLLSDETNGILTPLCQQDYLSFSGRMTEQKTQLQQAEQEFLLAETLFKKGITPKHDYDKICNQYLFEKNRLYSIKAQQLIIWQEKMKLSLMNLAEIASKIEQLKKGKNQYCIIAPISGTITGFSGIKAGNFVVPNQLIAKISPNDNLLVECYVSSSDIGLINKGMPVSFQFHAYNYNIWGIASGNVKEISGNVVSINSIPYFRIRCQLDQHFLGLKNGTRGELIKGMTVTGRFKVAERTLFQLLYDKADNWLNPKLKNG